jgi:hypothetical protein
MGKSLHSQYGEGVSFYELFLLAGGFGCMVAPIIATLLCILLAPARVSAAIIALDLLLAVLPFPSKRPHLATAVAKDAVEAVHKWCEMESIYNKDAFSDADGPFVIGTQLLVVLAR